MCGIAGTVSFSQKDVSANQIERMTDAIAHRGPDDSGAYISPDKKVGLGHRRLSILDLSPLGHQPMRYLDRYEIVFNGEVYNFQEEREALVKDGYAFASHSDTEVILALYDKYKEGCLDRLRGMFAFAIYDEKEQVLFCARDRVGKKPFKYFLNGEVFMFASELKAILTQKECPKEPDYEAIHHYLTLQYVPAPLTGFKGIKKLDAGHFLRVDLKTKDVQIKRYWKLDYSRKLSLSEGEWKERIMTTLDEAVRLRMISDVPVGAFLSGGTDSSAIVGLMSRHSPHPVKTFSIGFKEEQYNELPYAKQVAEKFGTEHTEFVVEPNAIADLPMLVRHYEEPYADSSALPTYYVSKLTRDHVTVALNGDGGDENFAGYTRYSIQKFAQAYDKLLPLHKATALPLTRALAKGIKNTLVERANRFAETLADDYRHRYVNYLCYFTNEMKAELYTSEFAEKMAWTDSYDIVARRFDEAGTKDKLDQMLYADIMTYLPDDLLAKVDIASMIVALEGRSPLLDHKLLELTAQIPFNVKLKGRDDKKHIFKKALEDLVPHDVMYRPKRGFSLPVEHWFRNELRDYAYDMLLSKKALSRGIFQEDAIRALLDAHVNTKISHAYRIWALVTLELWFQEYFD